MRSTSTTPDLVRTLGQLDSTMIVIGILIGSGIFIVSAESARLVGATGWLLVCLGARRSDDDHGVSVRRRACGDVAARRRAIRLLAGGLRAGCRLSLRMGALPDYPDRQDCRGGRRVRDFSGVWMPWIAVDHYLVEPIRLGRYAVSLSTQQLLAIAIILILTAVNTRGLKVGARIQTSLTLVKTAAFIGMIVLGLTIGWNHGGALLSASWWDPTANGWTPQQARPGLEATGALAFLLLLGLSMVRSVLRADRMGQCDLHRRRGPRPGPHLPRALIGGTAMVVTLYMLANLSYAATLPLDAIQHAPQNRVGTAMMEAILGTAGASVMAAAS